MNNDENAFTIRNGKNVRETWEKYVVCMNCLWIAMHITGHKAKSVSRAESHSLHVYKLETGNPRKLAHKLNAKFAWSSVLNIWIKMVVGLEMVA